jgi:glutaredoxin 3
MSTTAKNVVIYSTPTCHFCHQAKDFFKENDVTYTEYNAAGDAQRRQEVLELSGGLAVPVIVVDGEVSVGFDKELLTKQLGLAAA